MACPWGRGARLIFDLVIAVGLGASEGSDLATEGKRRGVNLPSCETSKDGMSVGMSVKGLDA